MIFNEKLLTWNFENIFFSRSYSLVNCSFIKPKSENSPFRKKFAMRWLATYILNFDNSGILEFMAPELLANDTAVKEASIADLMKADIRVYGMVVFNLINPGLQ